MIDTYMTRIKIQKKKIPMRNPLRFKKNGKKEIIQFENYINFNSPKNKKSYKCCLSFWHSYHWQS